MEPINERIVLASNGRAGDGNAEALLDYLLIRKTREVWVIKHPLTASEHDTEFHSIDIYRDGALADTQRTRAPFRPPYTYPLDLVLPRLPSLAVDRWIGFTNLNVARGAYHRRRFGVRRLVYVCVDFSEDRFGKSPLTRAYDAMDKFALGAADEIWPISQASHDARVKRLATEARGRVHVFPMGAWLNRTPRVNSSNYARKRLVFLGGLIEKQGVQAVIDALKLLDPEYELDVLGRGPYEATLKEHARACGVASRVHFHGFIPSHKDVEAALANATVAVACYVPEIASFSKYADPGKLKAYLGAGLPIVLTDVSPNAREVAAEGGGELVAYSAQAIADAVKSITVSEQEWARRSNAALQYVQQYDWPRLFAAALQVDE